MVGSSGVVRENEGGMGMGRVMSRSVNDGTEFPKSNSKYDTNFFKAGKWLFYISFAAHSTSR